MNTIGIETSCDETAIAILDDNGKLIANEISSQIAAHARFGGIVPEIAARMHAEIINHLYASALEEAGISGDKLGLIAVTVGPGLVPSLIVGISFARALAAALDKPIIGVNHLQGHLMSNFFIDPPPALPALCLLVSGGHTDLILVRDIGNYEILGRTRDDAAGEAFDKAARLMGIGYPGGPAIQAAALNATGPDVTLPRPMLHDESLDFSFSGLKTAVLNFTKRTEREGGVLPVNELAAGFQNAVTDVLVGKTIRAARQSGVETVLLCGGVAANQLLRQRLAEACEKQGLTFFSPPFELCTDNAAMVARAGLENFSRNLTNPALSPQPNISL